MNFEDLKIIWDAESARPSYTLDEEALHRIVRQRSHSFWKKIFFRDALEIGVAIVLIWQFLRAGIREVADNGGAFSAASVSSFLMTMGVAFVASFIFVSRQLQKRREKRFDESIQGNLRKLLSNISHQIRLLSNVAWWYLFPLVPGVVVFIVSTAEEGEINPWVRGLIVTLVFGGILWLNLRAVRKDLAPQKRELETLLSELESSGKSGEVRPALSPAPAVPLSRRLLGLSLAILLIGLGAWWVFVTRPPDDVSIGRWLVETFAPSQSKPVSEHGYAKVAPFTDVRWEEDRPIVRVGEEWLPLVSLDGIPMDRIMKFARETFGDLVHKRFAEDLPELLSKMGHDPQWDVKLEWQTKDGQTKSSQVRMTKRNRNLVRDRSRE